MKFGLALQAQGYQPTRDTQKNCVFRFLFCFYYFASFIACKSRVSFALVVKIART